MRIKFRSESGGYLVQRNHIINPVLVDCMSSDEIANQYADFLAAGFQRGDPEQKPIQRA